MEKNTVGELIRSLRSDRNLTQGQLAAYADVTRSWLARVELDERDRPNREMLERVAAVLRVPANTLLAAAGYRVDPIPITEPTDEELAAQLYMRAKKRAEEERLRREEESKPRLGEDSAVIVEIDRDPYIDPELRQQLRDLVLAAHRKHQKKRPKRG